MLVILFCLENFLFSVSHSHGISMNVFAGQISLKFLNSFLHHFNQIFSQDIYYFMSTLPNNYVTLLEPSLHLYWNRLLVWFYLDFYVFEFQEKILEYKISLVLLINVYGNIYYHLLKWSWDISKISLLLLINIYYYLLKYLLFIEILTIINWKLIVLF